MRKLRTTLKMKVQDIYHLNEEQKTIIEKAREQIKNGDYLTNEEANQEINQWLNK